MDWFTLCLNAVTLAAQGLLHMTFLCRLTGRQGRAWQFALYVLLLSGIEAVSSAAGWGAPAAMAAALAALYAMSRLALRNRPVPDRKSVG